MKNLLILLVILLFPVSLLSQPIDGQAQKLIEAFVKSNIDIQTEPVDPATVSKVFTGIFYKINVGFIETGVGSSSCGDENYINLNGSTVKMTEGIHMDLELPVFQSMLKKEFLLKDENAAKLFEAALNVLYPVDEEEKVNIRHMKKGTQWIFLRKKFFDDFTAFIVTVGTNGAVTKIEVKLAYTVN